LLKQSGKKDKNTRVVLIIEITLIPLL